MVPRFTRRRRSGAGARRRAGACVQSLEARTLLAGNFVISEFVASNTSTVADEDGQFNDWIEVHNTSASPAGVGGYSLTDDPALPRKWVFPNVTVPGNGYLLVFADGKDRRPADGSRLHANFSLNGDGEYLALFEPNGTTVATQLAPAYPNQGADVSYGTDPASPGGATWRYFATPTPGAANVRSEVVINEIHYDPDVKTELTEFVELYNPGTAAVDLGGAYFSNGITYVFPAGTTLAPHAYLTLAQNAAQYQAKFGQAPFAQFVGTLSNEGDVVTLRNRSGGMLDQVDYKAGFPWPAVGDAPGYSIELINPDFDNSVGGNWRAQAPTSALETTLLPANSDWRYFKGFSEASDPVSAWRQRGFDDSGWDVGTGPVGYDRGGVPMGTSLDDMFGNYTSVFMRTTFNVDDPSSISALRLEAQIDDGYLLWVNGVQAPPYNVGSAELPYTGTATGAIEDASYKPFNLPSAVVSALRAGENTIAVQFFNSSISNSSDAYFDARLIASTGGGGASPTPGARNSVFADNAAPQMRHVEHTPQQPKSGEVVTVTSLITDPDGVASVALLYQLVDPGNYINIDDPAYQTDWTTVAMKDDGTGGDATAGDGVYTVQLPADVQVNRRLVRYRVTATDGRGASITAPYVDDSVPNFAYFVYDGVPGWSGAARPGTTPVVNYSADVMNSVPAYHLISKNSDVEEATWWSKYQGDNYLWKGTLVYDGVVYDHISYRARGGVWRYAMVKNMWKFDFNHNHGFQAKDDYGKPYKTTWDKLNLGANIQQADFQNRGEQGLFESVGMKLFNLAGVTAPKTNYAQFRVIDDASEAGPTQYEGDLWGLYLAVEQPDGNFLDEHELPDGNLYKMEGGTGSLNNQGPTQPTDKSDLNAFQNGYRAAGQTDQWFRDNLNLDSYYGYRAIVEAIHHYDIDQSAGKNYFFYHNPETNQWETTVWDLDLTWADNMYGGGDEPFKTRVLPRPALNLEYKNRIREIRNLLYNPDQTGALIDEMAAKVWTAGQPSFVDVDRAMWDWNPHMASPSGESSSPGKAGQGRFYQIATTKDFPGMAAKMKAYVVSRGSFLDTLASDTAIPNKPTLTYLGAAGFPADDLRFRTSAFADPQGAGTFGAMEWRIAEVTNPAAPGYDPKAPKKYEINAAWESGELTTFDNEVQVPAYVVRAGRTYRVRVRMKDNTGRWSNWSDASQFVAGAPSAIVKDSLRITELNYHPAPNPAGPPAEDEFEFVELRNIGAQTINLEGVKFTRGIDYTFGDVDLPAGSYVVVAVNRAAFLSRYTDASINLAPGQFLGHLDNTGERITLEDGTQQVIQDFTYSDAWHPTTDGDGPTLVSVDPAAPLEKWGLAEGWRPSFSPGGSPGAADVQTDTTPPTADIVDVTPDPRTTPVNEITIIFSEPVTGFDLSDLMLHGLNGEDVLTAAQTLRTTDGGTTWILGNLAGVTAAPSTYMLMFLPLNGIRDAAGNAMTALPDDFWTVVPPTATVAGRHVFYNHSSFDGNDAAANAADDGAVPSNKAALLPGQSRSPANYTSYTRGINGLMVDVANLPAGSLGAGDFLFKVGNDNNPAGWLDGPAPASVTVRRGAGDGGSDRVTLVFADGAIRDQWLQVTVKANARTGLAAPDVFYFGNLTGEVNDSATTAVVNALDIAAIKRVLGRTGVDVNFVIDFDRDGRVNALDVAAAKSRLTRSLSSLGGAAPAAAFSTVPVSAGEALAPTRVWDESQPDLLGRSDVEL